MRRRISTNLRATKYIFIIIGAFFIVYLINIITDPVLDLDKLLIIFFFFFVNILLYYLFDRAKQVEYDNKLLYIIYENEIEQIPLEDVVKIKMTSFQINNRNLWKISYLNTDGILSSVKILPLLNDNIFETFISYMKTSNNKTEIQNWTHSFDFDQ
ncbi:MAG: hypothetical protein ACR2GN_04445 [Bacteroidia bacterium]